jgi:hypothetical protein
MPEGATIIGRVAVKVIPDTEHFERDVRLAVEEAERGLPKIKVDVELDASEAIADAKAASAAIDKSIRENFDIEINVEYESELNKALARIEAERIKLDREQWTIGLDHDSLNEATAEFQAMLDDMKRAAKDAEIEIDNAAFKSLRKAVQKQLKGITFSPLSSSSPTRRSETSSARSTTSTPASR